MHKFSVWLLVLCAVVVLGVGGGIVYWVLKDNSDTVSTTNQSVSNFSDAANGTVQPEPTTNETINQPTENDIAFFYQNVGLGTNAVRAGFSTDGVTVHSFGEDMIEWAARSPTGAAVANSYGDPVFSYLKNGHWTLTAWTSPVDPRGAGAMLYYEDDCPVVDESAVVALTASRTQGCENTKILQIGKTSQVFDAENGTYVFHATGSGIHLAQLSDENHPATSLEEICVLPEAVSSLDDLAWGQSTPISTPQGLLVSDTAVAQRDDGTWVLFVKGIEENNGCAQNTLCELCGRGIYRTTSPDLVNWSDFERVVSQASVPEATTLPDGTVRLYWQDFSDACTAQQQQMANIAPISTAYETSNGYQLSEPEHTKYPDEAFETNKQTHYATNGNPISLPNAEALEALEACF